MPVITIMIEEIICSKYKLLEKIGEGGFGEVYKSMDLITKRKYAVKVDTTRKGHVLAEAKILSRLQGIAGVPKLYDFGLTDKFSYLVMELLGKNLADLIKEHKKHLSDDQAASIGLEALKLIEKVHSKDLIHRDVKPHQLVLSRNMKKLFLVDYGLSISYKYSNSHIPFNDNSVKVGSCTYASLNTHQGYRQSRRDDLESLVFTLIFLVKGSLPWSNHSSINQWADVYSIKRSISLSGLCSGCPKEFKEMLTYIRGLKFQETPNYEYLKAVLGSIASKKSYKHFFCEKKKKKFKPRDSVILRETLVIKNPFTSFDDCKSTVLAGLPVIKDRSILNFKSCRI